MKGEMITIDKKPYLVKYKERVVPIYSTSDIIRKDEFDQENEEENKN